MNRPAAKEKTRSSGPSMSYLQTRIRASRLLNAARILAIIELTHRLHQAYRFAYDKQAADWLLPQNPAQPQTGTGGHTQTSDCAHIRANLLGDPRNRSALNDAWTRSQFGTNSAHEEGGLLGQVIDEGQPYQKDIVINQTYTTPSTSPPISLQGFTNWAQGQIASNSNTVAFGYWYHTHPFNQGAHVLGFVVGNPNVPSGNDASVSATLGLRGIIVSRTRIVVFDSSGNIQCSFRR